jgi:hypothetical protein
MNGKNDTQSGCIILSSMVALYSSAKEDAFFLIFVEMEDR